MGAQMGLIIRLLLFVAAPIAALFVAKDSLNFQIAQVFFAMMIFIAIGVVAAFWASGKKT
ncbi:hypothetical protein FZC33_03550 [Labrys sp. KNU-23]|nr:hypothetical protein FZC33_03550 [Labrys sp. KNU-23]